MPVSTSILIFSHARRTRAAALLAGFLTAALAAAPAAAQAPTVLTIFAAGTLAGPVAERTYHAPGLMQKILRNAPPQNMRDTETDLISVGRDQMPTSLHPLVTEWPSS